MASNQDTEERLKAALADRYKIEGEIGSGGMATVYLAEDLKHRRKVAVKVLDPELSAVIGAERFLTEIETTANLQHPHILPLFDSGEADGLLFYVMPYVEGESLRDRLDRETQLPVEDAVRITREVADGLSHAHGLEVIHRDIKPANILLSGGHALIADFGIARAVSVAGGTRLTETGLSLGTPQYMSPEQASGDLKVDARSDVYALGCVTHEMLVGEAPHTGPNAQAIIAKVLTESAPNIRRSRDTVPPGVDQAVAKALAKLPADRWQTTDRFSEALAAPAGHTGGPWEPGAWADQPTSVISALKAKGSWALPVTLGALVAALALAWLLARVTAPAPVLPPPMAFTVPAEGGLVGGMNHRLAVSPDGGTLAITGSQGLVIHPLGPEEPTVVEGTVGALAPFFSPSGDRIGFIRGSTVVRVGVEGGTPAPVSSTAGLAYPGGAAWRNDSTVVFVGMDLQLWEASDRGGSPRLVTALADTATEFAHIWPQAFDGGRRLVFTMLEATWEATRVVVVDLETGQRVTVARSALFGRYVPTGHILYSDDQGTIMAVRFDPDRMEVTGAPFPVETGVRVGYAMGPVSYAVSEAGTMAFVRGTDYERGRIVWLDRTGAEIAQVGPPVTIEAMRLSPDGRNIALYLARPGHDDIYTVDAESGRPQRITLGSGLEDNPIWSPDGRRIAYHSMTSATDHRVEVLAIGGSEAPEVIYSASRAWLYPEAWSSGGWITFREAHPERGMDLFAVKVDSSEHVIPVSTTDAWDGGSGFSPDGRWLVYSSGESGRSEIYVVAFPALTGKQQITSSGGGSPIWSPGGDALYFSGNRAVMRVGVSMEGDNFRWGTPEPVFSGSFRGVSPDGERFLTIRRNPESPAKEIHVITNWFEVLRAHEGT